MEDDLFLDEDDDLSLLLLDDRLTVPEELLLEEVLLFTVDPVFEADLFLLTVADVVELRFEPGLELTLELRSASRILSPVDEL